MDESPSPTPKINAHFGFALSNVDRVIKTVFFILIITLPLVGFFIGFHLQPTTFRLVPEDSPNNLNSHTLPDESPILDQPSFTDESIEVCNPQDPENPGQVLAPQPIHDRSSNNFEILYTKRRGESVSFKTLNHLSERDLFQFTFPYSPTCHATVVRKSDDTPYQVIAEDLLSLYIEQGISLNRSGPPLPYIFISDKLILGGHATDGTLAPLYSLDLTTKKISSLTDLNDNNSIGALSPSQTKLIVGNGDKSLSVVDFETNSVRHILLTDLHSDETIIYHCEMGCQISTGWLGFEKFITYAIYKINKEEKTNIFHRVGYIDTEKLEN